MLVIWKGKGFLALVLWCLVPLAPMVLHSLLDKKLGIPVVGPLDEHGFLRAMGILAILLPGIPMILLGLQRDRAMRLPDAPGKIPFLPRHPAHTLYRLNVFYWGVFSVVLGLYWVS